VNKTWRLLICVAITALALGCDTAPAKLAVTDFPGDYHVVTPEGRSTLSLRRDSTFNQTFINMAGRVRRAAGHWKFYTDTNGDYRIRFEDALDLTRPSERLTMDCGIESSAPISITLNEDENLYYRKIK